MATVKVGENAGGDIAIGVEVDGAFIPIASVAAHRVAQLVERHNDLQAKVEAGDEYAKQVVDSDFSTSGKSNSTSKSEGGSS